MTSPMNIKVKKPKLEACSRKHNMSLVRNLYSRLQDFTLDEVREICDAYKLKQRIKEETKQCKPFSPKKM